MVYVKKNIKLTKIIKKIISFTNYYNYDVKKNNFTILETTNKKLLNKILSSNNLSSKNFSLNNFSINYLLDKFTEKQINMNKLYDSFLGFSKSKPLLEQYVTDRNIINDLIKDVNSITLEYNYDIVNKNNDYTKNNTKNNTKDNTKNNKNNSTINNKNASIITNIDTNRNIQIDFGSGTGFLSLFGILNSKIYINILVEKDIQALITFFQNLIIISNHLYDRYENKIIIKKNNLESIIHTNKVNMLYLKKIKKKSTLSKLIFDLYIDLDDDFFKYNKKERSIKVLLLKKIIKKTIIFNDDLEKVNLDFLKILKDPIDLSNKDSKTNKKESNDSINKKNTTYTINKNKIKKIFIQNPPFGSKRKSEDIFFLKKCLQYATINDYIYSIHKTSTKQYIKSKIKESNQSANILIKDYIYRLPKTMWYHKNNITEIETSLFKIKILENNNI